jgi:hypothetical protein
MARIVKLDENRTITGSISSSVFQIPDDAKTVGCQISVATVTGTTPSMTPTLMHSIDGANFSALEAGSAMNSNGSAQLIAPATTKMLGRYLRVDYAVTGSTPVFSGVNATLQLI